MELTALRSLLVWHAADEWRESDGAVLWWHLPVCEPPLVGAHPCMEECEASGQPTECRRLIEINWLTHWSRLPDPRMMDFPLLSEQPKEKHI